jgi:hypothetical protein
METPELKEMDPPATLTASPELTNKAPEVPWRESAVVAMIPPLTPEAPEWLQDKIGNVEEVGEEGLATSAATEDEVDVRKVVAARLAFLLNFMIA